MHVPNGALDELIALAPVPSPEGAFIVGYTGNLGIAQGLGIVFDAAERLSRLSAFAVAAERFRDFVFAPPARPFFKSRFA